MTGIVRPGLLLLVLLCLPTTLGARPDAAAHARQPFAPLVTESPQQLATSDLPGVTKALTGYLTEHHQTAEDYVVSQFQTHDVVFMGESHLTRQRELFLQRLIPLLYKAGIRTLGYEMGCSEDQAAIDGLLNAPAYDEAAAFEILGHWDFSWPFQEYADVYRAAWGLNHNLPPGAPRFRILGIDIRPDYHRLPPGTDPMLAFRPSPDLKSAEARGLIVGGPDRDLTRNTRMAEILRREVLSKGQKALMFNGSGHSTTKYLRPGRSGTGKRMVVGYMIHQEIGDRAMGVLLRAPSLHGKDPVSDAVVATLGPGDASAGFTTRGSPVGALEVNVSTSDTLNMENLWDGLVFVHLKTPWEPSTANFTYLTDERLKRAKKEGTIPDLASITVESLKKDVLASQARVAAQIKAGGGY